MKTKLFRSFLIVFFVFAAMNCTRDFHNPYDRDCPPEIWTPIGFVAIEDKEEKIVDLRWEQPTDAPFDGYRIEVTKDSLDWEPLSEDLIAFGNKSFVHENLDLGDTLLLYRIKAFADLNQTEWVLSNRVGMDPLYFELNLIANPPQGGTVSGGGEYQATEEVTINASPNAGWHFQNWECSLEGDSPDFIDDPTQATSSFEMPGRNVTLTAHFKQTEYTLTLVSVPPEGAGELNGAGTYNMGENVTVSTISDSGYVFMHWTDENNQILTTQKSFIYTMPESNVTLFAYFSDFCDLEWECGDPYEFRYRDQYWEYGTFTRHGICWMDRNLGATQVPQSINDPDGFGDLFQWGRLDDEHQDRNSFITEQISNHYDPGHNMFIIYPGEYFPFDWLDPQNNNLWQGSGGINNPCPPGWRVPTETELEDERNSWSPANASGAFYSSSLKWPASGIRRHHTGAIEEAGERGSVWSSSYAEENKNAGWFGSIGLRYTSDVSTTHTINVPRASGYSVRCVRDIP